MVIVLTCVSSVSFTYSAINIIHGADSSLLLSGHTVVLTTTTTTLLEKPFKTKYRSTESAFSVCAPKLWNSLPREIRETENLELFKTSLKTHLFGIAYS